MPPTRVWAVNRPRNVDDARAYGFRQTRFIRRVRVSVFAGTSRRRVGISQSRPVVERTGGRTGGLFRARVRRKAPFGPSESGRTPLRGRTVRPGSGDLPNGPRRRVADDVHVVGQMSDRGKMSRRFNQIRPGRVHGFARDVHDRKTNDKTLKNSL